MQLKKYLIKVNYIVFITISSYRSGRSAIPLRPLRSDGEATVTA